MLHRTIPLLALLTLGLLGCSNELSGSVQVDGAPFALDSCRSGQVFGFVGVELSAADGRRLALVRNPTGTADVAVFAAGAETGTRLAECGTLTVENQKSTINSVRNVEGKATLKCEGAGHAIAGSVTFANCH